ncbi:conserved hypothetical protein [Methylobacterium sp. 4-46]|uniref:hypothetical protein n=1 Tax=unclassified Methylobacterium TaxID=2615210 RepID=UPI000152C64C|nr:MULTISPECIES: hypothetical protein [Methylobacterium]ACA15743.1 conserved hypothetical protein [Methylobacterium sp. 4-46]WFT81476.1 hypothetical protein QA634_06195 [Methylobacterium nodulans]
MSAPRILIPWDPAEAISIGEAAFLAHCSASTVRGWCACHHVGRCIAGGAWKVSAPAFLMLLDDDHDALAAYLTGDRTSPAVTAYFVRAGLPLSPAESPKIAKPPVRAVAG